MSSCCWTSKLWKYFSCGQISIVFYVCKDYKNISNFQKYSEDQSKVWLLHTSFAAPASSFIIPSLKFRAAAKNAFLETHICWCVVIFAILRILILRLIDRGCWHDWQVGTEIIFQSRTNEFYLICWVDQMKSWRRVIVWLCDDTHLASKI